MGALERYRRRKRLKAIRMAAQAGLFVKSSLTDGLRAVMLFEQMNGVPVDPSDLHHGMTITNSGWHFALQRKLRRLTDNQGKEG